MNVENRTLFIADNLDIMRGIDSETVDLIYLDPPFNTRREFQAPIGSPAEGASFRDIWTDEDIKDEWHGQIAEEHEALYQIIQSAETTYDKSMKIYLMAMAIRLFEMKRLLKPTGSIYLHCDPTASHYLKTVMDSLFGKQNFRNEIVWRRATAHNDPKRYGNNSDRLLYYSAGGQPIWNGSAIVVPKSPEEIESAYPRCDERGGYRSADLTGPSHGPSGGESSQSWSGYDINARGRVWSAPKTGTYAKWIEDNIIPNYRSIEGVHDRLDALNAAGLIYHPQRGVWPGLKRYAVADTGNPVQSLFTDISGFTNYNTGGEWTGYPTQKPLALLQRIIKASSNEGDIVLDPFCGCATACVAAEQLGRHWIGIDISPSAEVITKIRLQEEVDDPSYESNASGWFNPITDIVVSEDPPVRTDPPGPPRQLLFQDFFPRSLSAEYSQEQLQEFLSDKHRMYGNQEGKCNSCQYPLPFRNMTIDHIHPKIAIEDENHQYELEIPRFILNNPNHPENLQLLCGACNSKKGDRSQESLINSLREDGIIS